MLRNISLRYVIIKAELSLAAPHGENNFKESICHTLLPELHLYRITVQETSLGRTLNWPRNNMENLSVLYGATGQSDSGSVVLRLSEYSLQHLAGHFYGGSALWKASYLHKTTQTYTQMSSSIRTHKHNVRAAENRKRLRPPGKRKCTASRCISLHDNYRNIRMCWRRSFQGKDWSKKEMILQ